MTTPETTGAIDDAATDIVDGGPYKPDCTINFRVTSEERAQIKETAEALGLKVTDYLLRLHRAARSRVAGW